MPRSTAYAQATRISAVPESAAVMKLILSFTVLMCCIVNGNASQFTGDVKVQINNQSDLEQLLKSATIEPCNASTSRNITIRIAANHYTLDIPKFLRVLNLTNGDTLTMMGFGLSAPTITCVHYNTSLHESRMELENAFFADALKIVCNGIKFTRCQAPLRIENVSMVIIENCDFEDNQHGALNIFNSPNVMVKNCAFNNNTSDGLLTKTTFRASGGGLSISYNRNNIKEIIIDIFVSNCSFTNNAATLDLSRYSTDQTVSDNLYTGRGAGLAIIFNTTSPVNCTVTDCAFMRNKAVGGGGLFNGIGEAQYNQTYLFKNNMFSENSAILSGAFSFVILAARYTSAELPVNATIHNCTFQHNLADVAGSSIVYFIEGLSDFSIMFEECKFINNTSLSYAGAIDIVSYNFFAYRNSYQPVEFINCTFERNSGLDGAAINLGFYNARFNNVKFMNNTGSTVRVIAGIVYFENHVIFINNNANNSVGGALYLLSFSQLYLMENTNLSFINNTGRIGAAVVVETGNFTLNVFNHYYYSPLCFLQHYSVMTPPTELNRASLIFAGNEAVVGSDIYANKLDLCSWYSYDAPYFYSDTRDILRWPFIEYSDYRTDQRNISYNMSQPIQTPAVDFSFANDNVSAYPGEKITLEVMPVDEQGFNTTSIIQIKNSPIEEAYSFHFSPTAFAVEPPSLDFNVSYNIRSPYPNAITDIVNKSFWITTTAPEFPFQVRYINLTISSCPPGLTLQMTEAMDEHKCQCNDNYDQNIIECLNNEGKLIIKGGLWAHYIDTGTINGKLEYYQCPPDYCQCTRVGSAKNQCYSVYHFDNDDLQCVCDRKGYLCGQCRGNKGVSALLNNCVSCGYVNVLLIVALVITDAVVITVILLSPITFPSWLYPLLFYLQVTPYVAQYFPVTFGVIQPYLYYISSAVSLYFPYDFCLYPGMTALASYSFRYIPLLLLTIISSVIYIISRKFITIRLRWGGLWLLIMLTYTDVIYTSVSILNCPTLKTSNGNEALRWFVDGSVECFTGGHAALAVFAMMVLVLCLVMIIIIAAIVNRKIERPWIISIERMLTESFADEYNWWPPVELIRRIILICLILSFHRNLAPVVLCVMIYVAVYSYVQPCKSWYTNILETVLLIDLLVMIAISSAAYFKELKLSSDHSFSIDNCGQVDTISEHAAILIPFYFFPLIILFIIITMKIVVKIKCVIPSKNTVRHFSIARARSTRIVGQPTKESFELRINTLKGLSIQLIDKTTPH